MESWVINRFFRICVHFNEFGHLGMSGQPLGSSCYTQGFWDVIVYESIMIRVVVFNHPRLNSVVSAGYLMDTTTSLLCPCSGLSAGRLSAVYWRLRPVYPVGLDHSWTWDGLRGEQTVEESLPETSFVPVLG